MLLQSQSKTSDAEYLYSALGLAISARLVLDWPAKEYQTGNSG